MFHVWKIFLPWTRLPSLRGKWTRGLNCALRKISSKNPTSQARSSVHETCSPPAGLGQILPNNPMCLTQKVLSFEEKSMFQSKSSADVFILLLWLPALPLVILVGMFTFPLD